MAVKKLDRREAERFKLPSDATREGRVVKGYPSSLRQTAVTEIFDVSHTGIGFRMPAELAPHVGELIAIEFRLPQAPRMAWYAQVVRLEVEDEPSQSQESTQSPVILVGAKFLELPSDRKKKLRQAIDGLLEQAQADKQGAIHFFTENLRVRRSHEISPWRWARTGLFLFVSLLLAVWFVQYMMSIGSPALRGQGPVIWPGYKDNVPVSPMRPFETPIHKDSK